MIMHARHYDQAGLAPVEGEKEAAAKIKHPLAATKYAGIGAWCWHCFCGEDAKREVQMRVVRLP